MRTNLILLVGFVISISSSAAFQSTIELSIKSNSTVSMQIFYKGDTVPINYSEPKSVHFQLSASEDFQHLSIPVPEDRIAEFRIDFGSQQDVQFHMESLEVVSDQGRIYWNPYDIFSDFYYNIDIQPILLNDDEFVFKTLATGNAADPFIFLNSNATLLTKSKFFGGMKPQKVQVSFMLEVENADRIFTGLLKENGQPSNEMDSYIVVYPGKFTYYANFYTFKPIMRVYVMLGFNPNNSFKLYNFKMESSRLNRSYSHIELEEYLSNNSYLDKEIGDEYISYKSKSINDKFYPMIMFREDMRSRIYEIRELLAKIILFPFAGLLLYFLNKRSLALIPDSV